MKDRYLFRGKRKDNGEWETGSLVVKFQNKLCETQFITDEITGYQTPVDTVTIGQCTGVKDKNGILIFEGDIVEISLKPNKKNPNPPVDYFKIGWSAYSGWALFTARGIQSFSIYTYKRHHQVVVGNIHDNPEMLKEGLKDDQYCLDSLQ